MINPIEATKDGVIVTGERRYRAALSLGWTTVPVKFIEPPKGLRLRQLSENINRSDLAPLEISNMIVEALKSVPGSTIASISRIFGKSETWGYNYLKLLQLSPEYQKELEAGNLTVKDALTFTNIDDRAIRDFLFPLRHKFGDRNHIRRYAELLKNKIVSQEEVTAFLDRRPTDEQSRAWLSQHLPRFSEQIKANLSSGNRIMVAADALALALAQTDRKDIAPTQLARVFMSLSNVRSELEIATTAKFLPPAK